MYIQSRAFSYFDLHSDPRFLVVTTSDQLEKMMNALRQAQSFAFDYETDGLAWWRGRRPCGVAFTMQGPSDPQPLNWYVPFRHLTGQPQLNPEVVIAAQKELLEDPSKLKIAHNIKFEQHMSRVDGIKLVGPRCDTMIEAKLFNEDAEGGLKDRIVRDLADPEGKVGEEMLSKDISRMAKWHGLGITAYKDLMGYAETEIHLCGRYAAYDTFGTWRLHQFYEHQNIRSYYSKSPRGPNFLGIYDIEMALTDVLAKMEEVGQPLDVEYLKKLHVFLEEEKGKAEGAFFKTTDVEYFNLGSDDQLRDFLKKKLKCRWGDDQLTEKGQPAVDFAVLSEFAKEHPVLEHVLRYKETEKKLSTYTHALIDRADEDGILHCDFQQVGTRTGRLSCRKPNLQNISSDDDGRAKDFWKQYPKDSWESAVTNDHKISVALRDLALMAGYGCDAESIKRAFIVQRKSPGILSGVKTFRMFWDYSQIELRVLAEYTQDARLVKAYLEDKDIHDEVERAVFGTGIEYSPDGKKIDGPNRRKAKCFHPDTEVLTRTGWKKILNLQPGEEVVQATPSDGFNVALEWVVPTEVFSKPNHSDRLVHLYNEGVDIRVTPDHRMLVWGSPNGKPEPFKVVTPYEVHKQRGWMNAGVMSAGSTEVDETTLRLAVALQADGSLRGSAVTFGFSKERKKARMRALLGSRKFSERTNSKNVTTFYIPAADFKCLLTDSKEFPWSWLDLTPALRAVVLDEIRFWDSHVRPNWRMVRYTSISGQSLDVIQAIAALSNRKTRMAQVTDNRAWNLSIRDKPSTRGGTLKLTEIKYSGEVACLSVPSTFVLVRGGKAKVPLVIGQTINFGLAYGMSPIGFIRQIQGVTLEEAKGYFNEFNAKFPGVLAFKSKFWAYLRAHGCQSDNKFGRTGRVPSMMAQDAYLRGRSERMSFSSLIQGTAAELTKQSLVLIDQYLESKGLQSRVSQTIHDEIQIDGPVAEFAEVSRASHQIMTDFPDFSIPIRVDGKYSTTHWCAKQAIPGLK